MAKILSIKDLTKKFGRIVALDQISFDVEDGDLIGLVGPNGAGKTTLFDLITGSSKPTDGSIILAGENITDESPAIRSQSGIGRTYQIPRPFARLTVYENVLVAATHGGKLDRSQSRSKALDLLELTGLAHTKDHLPVTLNSLQRKMLEIARALGTNPKLLLLDELASGVTEAEFQRILNIVQRLHEASISILWVEHRPKMMTHGVERLLVLAEGKILADGRPSEVISSTEVVNAFLGSKL